MRLVHIAEYNGRFQRSKPNLPDHRLWHTIQDKINPTITNTMGCDFDSYVHLCTDRIDLCGPIPSVDFARKRNVHGIVSLRIIIVPVLAHPLSALSFLCQTQIYIPGLVLYVRHCFNQYFCLLVPVLPFRSSASSQRTTATRSSLWA